MNKTLYELYQPSSHDNWAVQGITSRVKDNIIKKQGVTNALLHILNSLETIPEAEIEVAFQENALTFGVYGDSFYLPITELKHPTIKKLYMKEILQGMSDHGFLAYVLYTRTAEELYTELMSDKAFRFRFLRGICGTIYDYSYVPEVLHLYQLDIENRMNTFINSFSLQELEAERISWSSQSDQEILQNLIVNYHNEFDTRNAKFELQSYDYFCGYDGDSEKDRYKSLAQTHSIQQLWFMCKRHMSTIDIKTFFDKVYIPVYLEAFPEVNTPENVSRLQTLRDIIYMLVRQNAYKNLSKNPYYKIVKLYDCDVSKVMSKLQETFSDLLDFPDSFKN